jgi:hypothetical protein
MGTISKEILSGSANGRPIQILQVSTPGNILHTTGVTTTTVDEVWIYATNNDAVTRNLTIEWGTTGAPSEIIVSIPSKSGLSIIIPGIALTGTGVAGNVIRAYASVSSFINVVGYINRMVP